MQKEIILDIKNKIYTIRNKQVMIDEDLAQLYGVKVKRLNEQVKRNIERFPANFMFQLTEVEVQNLKSQNATSSWGGRRTPPYAFTEQGVAMISAVLKSQIAIEVSIQIMNAFVIMRRMIATNHGILQRVDGIEQKLLTHDNKINQIFNLIEDKQIKPNKGIFFNGQIFDAHKFVSDLIRSAKKSIILIDNYVDDCTLTLFNKRDKNINVLILSKKVTKETKLDLKRYNSQYPEIDIKEFKDSHDRFLIIDYGEVYHFGASLKDLGKKWFAFSKFDKKAFEILRRIKNEISNTTTKS